MKKIFENKKALDLMTWSDVYRKDNGKIQFLLDNNKEINIGDFIIGDYSPEKVSCYEILSVTELTTTSKRKRFECDVKHSFVIPKTFMGFDTENISLRLKDLIL